MIVVVAGKQVKGPIHIDIENNEVIPDCGPAAGASNPD